MITFEPFPKIGRYSRSIIVTEKIDGTNAQVIIEELFTDQSYPHFAGQDIHTSWVVDKWGFPTHTEIETRNSYYTLVKGDTP